MKIFAVIVAGGSGSRMGGIVPKQFQLVKGKSVIWHSVHAFTTAIPGIKVILVLPKDFTEEGNLLINDFSKEDIQITQGGITRFESVKNGLALTEEDSIIMVHDAVRCLVSPALISHCLHETIENGNAVPVIPVTDTMRIITGNNNRALDRDAIRAVQTPQCFRGKIILDAFRKPFRDHFTDEASVVENNGIAIHLVEGEVSNIKITHPADLLLAEQLLR
jgi:2-C-methyl-D-erythritol 4-phosphate cytidylyltransferase